MVPFKVLSLICLLIGFHGEIRKMFNWISSLELGFMFSSLVVPMQWGVGHGLHQPDHCQSLKALIRTWIFFLS